MTRSAIVTAAALSLLAFASPALGAARPYDFDGDGRQELAVGDPTYSESDFPRVAGHAGAGIVVRTDANGLVRSGQLLARGHDGFPGQTSNDVQLGRRVASGDFNGDGRADIALLKGTIRRGMVVLYGSPQGIRPSTAVNYNGDDTYFLDATAADVDGDRFDDLAVRTARPSRVAIYRGGPGGLPPVPSTTLAIAPTSMRLADLNRDGHPELAYAEDGRAGVCRGTAGGLGACSSARSAGAATDVATGDVTGGRALDVAVGLPEAGDGGSVNVYRFVNGRLHRAFTLTQRTRGVPGHDQYGDDFGWSVDIGQIGRGAKRTLVVGAPGEDRGKGRVTLVRGAKRRVARRGNRAFSLAAPGVPGGGAAGFGQSLTLLDHDGDGRLDLDVGAPFEDTGHFVAFRAGPGGLIVASARDFDLPALGVDLLYQSNFGLILGRR